jgi:hypothetical protein
MIRLFAVIVGLTLLAGCADHPVEVPLDGQKVAEGNSKLMYKAPRAGEIFVYEDPGSVLVYRAGVRSGDTIEVDTKADEITRNGRTVSEKKLNPNKTYKMFFDAKGARRN